jgi:hypothetical protein
MIASFSESVTSRLSAVFQTSHVGPISENFPSVPAFLSLISERADRSCALLGASSLIGGCFGHLNSLQVFFVQIEVRVAD